MSTDTVFSVGNQDRRTFIAEYHARSSAIRNQKFSPRIEESLSAMSNPTAPRQILIESADRLLKGLRAHMAKEAKQVAFFKQLRILNPRRLCDLSRNLLDYLESSWCCI